MKVNIGGNLVVSSLAYLVIIITGLKLASTIILPFLMAIFLFVLFLPLVNRLRLFGLPDILATIIVFALMVMILFFISTFLISSVHDITSNINIYQNKFYQITPKIINILEGLGIPLEKSDIVSLFDPSKIINYTALVLKNMGNILTNSFITILVVVFLFLELSLFEKKLVLLINLENQEKLNRFLNNINTYFITKTFTSFMTGLFVWIMLSIFNLDYALLFGIMAFLLNFIPSIGSIIAAIPALLIALLQLNIVDTFLIMFWYLVINIVISNFIEPKIMGEKVGLSTLVIFVSMIIWGWIFGPVGMLLAVPLTIIIKIAFDNSEKYHWVSVILSDTIIENIKKEENRKSII